MARRNLPPHLIYAVCERFFRKHDPETGRPWSANRLAEWLGEQGYPTNREAIFPLLRHAIDRGFLELCPPREFMLGQRLARDFPLIPADTRIFNVLPPHIIDNLASETARLVVELITQVDQEKNARAEERQRVHIGFGAGGTALAVSKRLSQKLDSIADLPPLTIHAISSGFDIADPLSAPTSFFSYFTDLNHDIEFVGFYSAAVVPWSDYEQTKSHPVTRDSFAQKDEIDILVTSFAQADDEHGMLNEFLEMHHGETDALQAAGHVGDVSWQPYSATGSLAHVDTGIRAMTLFELDDLVRMASTTGKHVVLVAGPCVRCGAPKTRALRPLLTVPQLRVANHIITDVRTARELLAEPPQGTARRASRPREIAPGDAP